MKNLPKLNSNSKSSANKIESKVSCNCFRSKCTNMYCACLKFGKFCGPSCYCINCKNNLHSSERSKNITKYNKRKSKLLISVNSNTK